MWVFYWCLRSRPCWGPQRTPFVRLAAGYERPVSLVLFHLSVPRDHYEVGLTLILTCLSVALTQPYWFWVKTPLQLGRKCGGRRVVVVGVDVCYVHVWLRVNLTELLHQANKSGSHERVWYHVFNTPATCRVKVSLQCGFMLWVCFNKSMCLSQKLVKSLSFCSSPLV